MKIVLGLNAFHADTSACLIKDNKIIAAIEEEMAAVRELYVGGYISKGVYITETDRLYEKAKIFGL